MSLSIEMLPLFSSVLLGLLAIYALIIKRSVTLSERNLTDMVDELAKEVQGISHGSMGVGRKVLLLEQQVEALESCIEEMQKNDPNKVSYSEASRLVEMGAGVDDLMNSCGISRPEAELVSALTANKKDEVPTLMPEKFQI